MANFFENATGWQTIDLDTGKVIGGGTFTNLPTVPSVLPSPSNAGYDWSAFTKGFGIESFDLSAYSAGGNAAKSSGGAGGGYEAGTAGGSAGAPYSTPDQGGSVQGASFFGEGTVADYFLRGVIIILGFIFVAVGLNMMKPGLVPVPAAVGG